MLGDEPRVRFVLRIAVARHDHAEHLARRRHLAEPTTTAESIPPLRPTTIPRAPAACHALPAATPRSALTR